MNAKLANTYGYIVNEIWFSLLRVTKRIKNIEHFHDDN